jgi:hypothetical protein
MPSSRQGQPQVFQGIPGLFDAGVMDAVDPQALGYFDT